MRSCWPAKSVPASCSRSPWAPRSSETGDAVNSETINDSGPPPPPGLHDSSWPLPPLYHPTNHRSRKHSSANYHTLLLLLFSLTGRTSVTALIQTTTSPNAVIPSSPDPVHSSVNPQNTILLWRVIMPSLVALCVKWCQHEFGENKKIGYCYLEGCSQTPKIFPYPWQVLVPNVIAL